MHVNFSRKSNPFGQVRDTDVRRYDLGYTHEGGEPVAEEQCLIDPSCVGFVDLRNVRYLKYKVDPKRRRHARGVSVRLLCSSLFGTWGGEKEGG